MNQPAKRATALGHSPASRARSLFLTVTWGLRPRLYAVARFAGSASKNEDLIAVLFTVDGEIDGLRDAAADTEDVVSVRKVI